MVTSVEPGQYFPLNYQLYDIYWLHYLWSEKLVVTRTARYRLGLGDCLQAFIIRLRPLEIVDSRSDRRQYPRFM